MLNGGLRSLCVAVHNYYVSKWRWSPPSQACYQRGRYLGSAKHRIDFLISGSGPIHSIQR
jgi:hypothetical protein